MHLADIVGLSKIQNFIKNLMVLFLFSIFPQLSFASLDKVPLEIEVRDPQGNLVNSSSVNIVAEIRNESGTCILRKETLSSQNIVNGIVRVELGTNTLPSSGHSVKAALSNASALSCLAGSGQENYTPTINEARQVKLTFSGVSSESLDVVVPLGATAYAISAQSLNGKSNEHFLNTSSNVTQSRAEAWFASTVMQDILNGTYRPMQAEGISGVVGVANGGTGATSAEAARMSLGLGSLSVMSLPTSASSSKFLRDDGVWASASPMAGTAPGTFAAGDDVRIINAIQNGGGVVKISSGNSSDRPAANSSVNQLFVSKDSSKIYYSDGANWIEVGAKSFLPGIELDGLKNISGAGVIVKVSPGSYSTVALSNNAAVDSIVKTDSSGAISTQSIVVKDSTNLSANVSVKAAPGTSSYVLKLPNSAGTNGQVLATDGAGNLRWDSVPSIPSTDCSAGQVLTFQGGAYVCVTDATAAGGGDTTGISINGYSSSSHSLNVITTTGTTSPSWASSSGTHNLVIPMASSSGVTAGLISKSDYDVFMNKQSSLGFIPLNKGANLSDISSVTLARQNLGLGTAALKNTPSGVNADSGEVVLGSDTRLSDARQPSGAASGDLSGSYPNPSVTKIQGRFIAATSPSDGQALVWDTNQWVPRLVKMQDLRNNIGLSAMPSTACGTHQAMYWSAATDSFACQNIGGLDASAITSGTISMNRLPAGISSWQAVSGGINFSGGHVGINTSSPLAPLHVTKSFYASSNSSMAFFKATDDQIDLDLNFVKKGSSGGYADFSFIDAKVNNGTSAFRVTGDKRVFVGTDNPLSNAAMEIRTKNLGSGYGNVSGLLRLAGNVGNESFLDISTIRTSSTPANEWFSAGTRIQQKIDETFMAYIQFNGKNNEGGISFGTGQRTEGAIAIPEAMRINQSGQVIVGSIPYDAPGSKLLVGGYIISNGTMEFSDQRLKKDIVKEMSSLEKLEKIQGVSYSWRTDEFPALNLPKNKHMGVIAQEVEKVFPLAVQKDDKSGIKTVSYNMLIAPIIEAIKELKSLFDKESAEQAELKQKVAALEEKNKLIEQQQVAMKKALCDLGKTEFCQTP